jgi:hypothetical protein
MKRTVVDCDKCGKECSAPILLVIPNGIHRYNDGVENNVDFLYEDKDMCPECTAELLKFMFRHKKNEGKSNPLRLDIAANHQHPNAEENDAIRLALRFFGIKEKD